MAFHEVRFPDRLSYGSEGGPGGSTSIVELDSGAEERNARWNPLKHSWDVSYGVKSREDIAEVLRFYHQRGGLENGFRFRDPNDHNSTEIGYNDGEGPTGQDPDPEDVEIGTGDGTTTQFQLVKKYSDGLTPTRTRNIRKPIDGTVLVALDGVAKVEDTDFTVDYTTGIVTFATAPAGSVSVTAGFEFDVPVRFGAEIDQRLGVRIDTWDSATIPSLPIVEILDDVRVDEDFWLGGSNTFEFGANTQLALIDGRVKVATATTTGLKLLLPDPDGLPLGAPYLYVVADAGTDDFVVAQPDGTTVAAMTEGDIVQIILYVGADGVRKWRAV